MPKLKTGTIMPTDEEDNLIRQGIAQDSDTYELSEEEFFKLRPNKQQEKITLRLSPKVTQYFKATGKNWQSRIDEVLLEYIETHQEID